MPSLQFDNRFVRELPADPERGPRLRQVQSALFSHVDRDRGHVRMAFSQSAPQYAARFIATCMQVGAAHGP